MRKTPINAALVFLTLFSSTLPAAPATGTLHPVSISDVSHGAVVPFMHTAALDIPAGIRPGAWLQSYAADGVSVTADCTAAFVVANSTGTLFLTMAGHCTDFVGQRIGVTQDAPVALGVPSLKFGTVVAHWPSGADAALVEIDVNKYYLVNPTMAGRGGPTGLLTYLPTDFAVPVRQYGWGWMTWYEHNTRCRTGVADWPANTGTSGWSDYKFWYEGQVGGGDSGSAVITADGLAIGIADYGFGAPTPLGNTGVIIGGPRFDFVLSAFGSAMGEVFALVTGGPVNSVCSPDGSAP